jgi:hypothetical protein
MTDDINNDDAPPDIAMQFIVTVYLRPTGPVPEDFDITEVLDIEAKPVATDRRATEYYSVKEVKISRGETLNGPPPWN